MAGRVVGFGPLGRPIVLVPVRPWVRRWAFEPGGFGWRPAFRRWRGERRWAVVEPRREAVEVAPPPPAAIRHRAPAFATRGVAEAAPTRPARSEPIPAVAPFARPRAAAFAGRAAPAQRVAPPLTRPAQSAVAVMPAAALPPPREVPHAVIKASVLSTAAVLRRVRHPRPATEPAALQAATPPHRDDVAPARAAEPAALRSDPAPREAAAPPAPTVGAAKPSEVPAAPLD